MLPDAAALEADRALVSAFESGSGGAFSHRGKMVDLPVVAAARRRIAMAARAAQAAPAPPG